MPKDDKEEEKQKEAEEREREQKEKQEREREEKEAKERKDKVEKEDKLRVLQPSTTVGDDENVVSIAGRRVKARMPTADELMIIDIKRK